MQVNDIQVIPPTRQDGANDMRLTTWNFTASELRTLNSAPVTLVTAKGSGFAVVPVMGTFQYKGGTIGFTNDVGLTIGYSLTPNLLDFGTVAFTGTTSRLAFSTLVDGSIAQSAGENVALILKGSADPAGATADGIGRLALLYYVLGLR